MKTHKDLDAWKVSLELAADVYRTTDLFPKSEMYGLTSQMRRAAVSISSNIAEGAARQSKKEYVHFLYVSLGSSSELETQIELSRILGFASDEQAEELLEKQSRVARMISGVIRKWKK